MSLLFRYRAGKKYDIDNLKTHKLWMGNPLNFNDPYDCAAQLSLTGRTQFLINTFLSQLLKKNMNLDTDANHINPEVTNLLINELKNKMGKQKWENQEAANFFLNLTFKQLIRYKSVACFNPSNQSVTMWSYYSDYHKGFCIAYDSDDLKKIGTLNPVSYSDDFNIFYVTMNTNLNDKDSYFKKVIDKLILTKASGWSQEHEWRLIVNSDHPMSDDEEGFSIDSPKPIAIYVGCNADKNKNDIKEEIANIAVADKIPVYQMKTIEGSFKLDSSERIC